MTKQKTPKITIQLSDRTGTKYSFAVEGNMSNDKVTTIMQFVQSLSLEPSTEQTTDQRSGTNYSTIDTTFSRVYTLIQSKFKFGSFSSNDISEAYLEYHDEQLPLSTIATYLARLTERGLVQRTRNGNGWIYKITKTSPQELSTSLSTTTSTIPVISQNSDILQ